MQLFRHYVILNFYSSRIPNIGEVRTLMIDPQNYNHFYDPSTRGRTRMITTVVGVAMLLIGMVAGAVGILILLAASFL